MTVSYVSDLLKRLKIETTNALDATKKILYWLVTNQQSWEVPCGTCKVREAKQWIVNKSGIVRGHSQMIFVMLNVILMLRGSGVLILVHVRLF